MTAATFLFTDIEGSTRLWEAHPEAMREALATHDELTTKHVEANGGHVFKHMGDGAIAAFGAPSDAVQAAADIQAALAEATFPDVGTLRVRMGIHTGEAEERDGDYFGPTLNRGARVMAAGHGGQVLLSTATTRLVGEDGLVDLGEHRLKDLSAPEHLFQVASSSDFPPLRTLDVERTNLPVFGTSFVGRQAELEEATERLAGARLLTITGVGGAGKTRLALQVAADVEHRFTDGAWLVELGAVADPDLVIGAFAEGLRVIQADDQDLATALADHLRHRAMLVVVDNCEHLVDEVAHAVEDLMAVSPDSVFIATSRELLGIPGEVAFALRSMGLPARNTEPDPDELMTFDAVRLFTERARAADRRFVVDAGNGGDVLEICRRLDGMPLALELAASRLRTFDAAKLAELLDQRFRLLTGGSRTALPRQQTLAATIEWSYRLLDEPEQALLRRLSAFQGGFTYDSVVAVTSREPIDEFDLIELLPSLVDKSLVVADEVDGTTRYRLLETIRQFARDLFEDTDEADDVRLIHATHFETLSREAGKNIRGPDEAEWWARIDTELDNLRQAMTWAIEHDRGAMALSIATGFWRFWWFKGRWTEGATWIGQALEATGDDAPDLLLAEGLLAYGSLLDFTTAGFELDPGEALERSIELYRELHAGGIEHEKIQWGFAAALINLSVRRQIEGDLEATRLLNEEALVVAREIGDPTGVTIALGNLAESAMSRGDFDEARRLHAEAIEVSETLGSNQRLADGWGQLAQFELWAGDPAAAAAAGEKALHYAEQSGLDHLSDYIAALVAMEHLLAGNGSAAAVDACLQRVASHRTFLQATGFLLDLLAARLIADVATGNLRRAATVLGAGRSLLPDPEGPNGYLVRYIDQEAERIADELGPDELARLEQAGADLDRDGMIDLLTD